MSFALATTLHPLFSQLAYKFDVPGAWYVQLSMFSLFLFATFFISAVLFVTVEA